MGFLKSVLNGYLVNKSLKEQPTQIIAELQEYKTQSAIEKEQFNRYTAIHELYKANKDVKKALASMEQLLLYDNPPMVPYPAQIHFITDLYLKDNQDDKAWGYLNSLITNPNIKNESIYREMAWMLKKEKRHKDAIWNFMIEYFYAGLSSNQFSRDSFLKEIGVSIRALKWSDEAQNKFADIVDYQFTSRHFDVREMKTMFEKYVDTIENQQ